MTKKELEKEAEERVKHLCLSRPNAYVPVTSVEYWQDGAEFGYNKCKEEINQKGLALQSDMDKTIEQNVALKKLIEQMKCCGNCVKWENCEKDEMFSQDICNNWGSK